MYNLPMVNPSNDTSYLSFASTMCVPITELHTKAAESSALTHEDARDTLYCGTGWFSPCHWFAWAHLG